MFLKYQKFPIGHPENIVYDFKPVTYAHCIDDPCKYKKNVLNIMQFPYFRYCQSKNFFLQEI